MVNFNAAPNKKAKLTLETTAFKQSRSDLNVAFSTADRETGIFEFTVTQNNKPLLLGNDNIKSSIVFIHSNGLKMKAPLVITDGMNGKISYQVPDDIIATPGKVTSQVYVARKSKEETYAVVAERIFSFEIEKSLAWEFDAETKLNYIVEFDELEAQLKQRLYAIEEAMSNLEDYVARVEQARDKGLSDIEIATTNNLDELNTLASEKLDEINTTGMQYVNDLTEVRNGIDDKIEQFNDDVDAGGYVKDTDTTEWQKQSITDDDGFSIYLETIDFMNVENSIKKSGLYYVADSTNGIDGENKNGLINAHFRNADNGLITFMPMESNKVYYLQKTNSVWSSFTKVDRNTLGFNPESEIGAQNKADIALESAKAYVDDQLNTRRKTLWSGNASEKGTVLSLTDSYKNYSNILIGYVTLAGHKTYDSLIFSTTSIFPIQDFNLGNADGGTARFYESGLRANSNTELVITHNHTYVPETNSGTANSNAVEFITIVGVK
ncbi:BppU family phage baseplate upper protein [Mammaliicoccus sp. G-M31]|uniref:BppU family phage baseplate upper protein n=1 Tax=Mammaliicoccus sp. G-M31 TaxID=2898690 RepID=UPI001EFAD421|nr:BppU family phage baseplate upper protein [Mammaliicoccus sp. G-M31]